jgi:hypothetical protein
MKTHTVTCEDCGKQREVRIDKNPPRCRSCAQRKGQAGRRYSNRHGNGRKCASTQCDRFIRPDNQLGYCYKCFHANVDNIKTLDQRRRGGTVEGRIKGYAQRGGRITPDDLALYDNSTNCEICNREFTPKNKCLDHCHSTGRFRGALCKRCNGALGNLGDDLDLIIERLENYKCLRTS